MLPSFSPFFSGQRKKGKNQKPKTRRLLKASNVHQKTGQKPRKARCPRCSDGIQNKGSESRSAQARTVHMLVTKALGVPFLLAYS